MNQREKTNANRTVQSIKKCASAFALFLALGAFATHYLDQQETRIAGFAIAALIVVFGLRHIVGRQDPNSRYEEIERKKQRMSEPRSNDDA